MITTDMALNSPLGAASLFAPVVSFTLTSSTHRSSPELSSTSSTHHTSDELHIEIRLIRHPTSATHCSVLERHTFLIFSSCMRASSSSRASTSTSREPLTFVHHPSSSSLNFRRHFYIVVSFINCIHSCPSNLEHDHFISAQYTRFSCMSISDSFICLNTPAGVFNVYTSIKLQEKGMQFIMYVIVCEALFPRS